MTKRERQLIKSGYQFSGYYTSKSKELAKQKAAEYRANGYQAQVLTETFKGRVYSTEGYSVYIKKVE